MRTPSFRCVLEFDVQTAKGLLENNGKEKKTFIYLKNK